MQKPACPPPTMIVSTCSVKFIASDDNEIHDSFDYECGRNAILHKTNRSIYRFIDNQKTKNRSFIRTYIIYITINSTLSNNQA